MRLLCIDPGPKESGVVILDRAVLLQGPQGYVPRVVLACKDFDSEELIRQCLSLGCSNMAIEGIQSFGMAVGASTFDTAEMVGRMRQAFGFERTTKIFRGDEKMTLCGSMRAKAGNIRQAIIDRYPATGGGKTPQVGTKRDRGPLYGLSSHAWSALAVGLTYLEIG